MQTVHLPFSKYAEGLALRPSSDADSIVGTGLAA